MPDPFDQVMTDLSADSAVGVLAIAQLNGSPYALRLLVQTRQIDAAAGGLRPQNDYVVDVTGVTEHQLTLGLFNHIGVLDDHPLLIHHNAPRVNVFLAGTGGDIQAVESDLVKAHDDVYQGWRDPSMDMNRAVPLDQLLRVGFGLLGKMPQPYADAVSVVLTQHGIAHNRVPAETPGKRMLLLLIEESFIVASDVTVQNITDNQDTDPAES